MKGRAELDNAPAAVVSIAGSEIKNTRLDHPTVDIYQRALQQSLLLRILLR